MFYHLLYPLSKYHPVFNVFQYITFRTIYAAVTALVLSFILGTYIIKKLSTMRIGEVISEDSPSRHDAKAGTPTMGGIIILCAMMISIAFWGNFTNSYIWVLILVTLGMGLIGFMDDYKKVITRTGDGLKPRTKFSLQLILAFAVAIYLYTGNFNTILTVPFLKEVRIDMGWLYIPFAAFVIVGASNAVNLTDGLDGLATGPLVVASATFMLLAYITGHVKIADYLQLLYVPHVGEVTVYAGAMVGATLGFLWFNTYPAQVFMGDVGSLSMGGALGTLAIITKHEILLALIGGIFVLETLSVIFQVASYKLRGKRVFLMAPAHHHFELKGWPEPRIIVRFWIIAIILSLIAISTLKLR